MITMLYKIPIDKYTSRYRTWRVCECLLCHNRFLVPPRYKKDPLTCDDWKCLNYRDRASYIRHRETILEKDRINYQKNKQFTKKLNV
jgi:hypothetical protein